MLMCSSIIGIVFITGLIFSTLPLCQTYSFRIVPLRPSVVEGGTVNLVCEVLNTNEDEEYIFIWEKDGEIVAGEHSVMGPTRQTRHRMVADLLSEEKRFMFLLKIEPVNVEDAGEYSCSAEESMKVRKTSLQRAVLMVNQVPGSQYPKCLSEIDGGFPEGEEVTITCVSELVTPPVTLQWQRDGQSIPTKIENNVKEGLIKAHYTFTPTPDDSGSKFICDMRSSAIKPSKRRQCEINSVVVLHKPIIRIRYPEIVHVGKESIFICESFANPILTTYEWTFSFKLSERILIDDTTHQILRLLEPSLSDDGAQITCMATNSIGTSSSTVTMHVRKETATGNQHTTDELIDDGIYDYNTGGYFLGVPTSIAILGLSGVVIFLLFVTITPVCYCCLCGRRVSSKESIAQPDVYIEPKDSRILPQVPTSDDLAPWMRSVASQVPDDWDVEYSEIGGKPPPLKIAKCSCV
ncbi:cell adhesion molecule 4-like [Anneissia japonica]|uniref:cell adhesion molecule 4-like n=1 Tax=Anneissia japonica TaxID=1529436 RepID=UPI001425AEC5|nr:cell adhesion molecule 4-like [Anneissia japonica]